MALPECKNVGASEMGLAIQLQELEPFGITIRPNPQDDNLCYYSVEDKYLDPVNFDKPYIDLPGKVYNGGRYLYFNEGTTDEIPPEFAGKDFPENMQITSFLVLELEDSGFTGVKEDIWNIEETIKGYFQTQSDTEFELYASRLHSDKAGNYRQFTVYRAKSDVAQLKVNYRPLVKEDCIGKRPYEETDAISQIPPTEVDQFVKRIIDTARVQAVDGMSGEVPSIVFAIDHSGTMEYAIDLTIKSVAKLVTALMAEGVKKVNVGAVLFNDTNSITSLLPLGPVNADTIGMIFDRLGGIRFRGGSEPVGEAAIVSISMLKEQPGKMKQVVVLTDDDGLFEDQIAPPTLNDAILRGKRANIAVQLYKIEEEDKLRCNSDIWAVAQVQKVLIMEGRNAVVRLATSFEDMEIRLEAADTLVQMGEWWWKNAVRQIAESSSDKGIRERAKAKLERGK
ncbi:MAG: VWA domain-containing protein [Deltaproteobacteria bacterium]|nr:VWA domain-containing protein [Deltaproteobacteria bacterium]MBI2974443.1 VWA domain-containing protein [Deltaproteobacteria bacterium]